MALDPALVAAGKAAGMSDAEIAALAGGGNVNSRKVYSGRSNVSENPKINQGAKGSKFYRDEDDVVMDFYRWSPQQRSEWGKYLVANGVLDESDADNYQSQLKAWGSAVEESANFTAAKRDVDPRGVIKLLGAAGGSSGRAKTVTSTQKSYNLTDPTSARALVNSVLSSQLGREANADEIREFTKVLNAAEEANPSVSTQTTTTNADGSSNSSTSRTSGGLDAGGKQQLMVDRARKAPDYAAYQASTTYMDALMGALQAPV